MDGESARGTDVFVDVPEEDCVTVACMWNVRVFSEERCGVQHT